MYLGPNPAAQHTDVHDMCCQGCECELNNLCVYAICCVLVNDKKILFFKETIEGFTVFRNLCNDAGGHFGDLNLLQTNQNTRSGHQNSCHPLRNID